MASIARSPLTELETGKGLIRGNNATMNQNGPSLWTQLPQSSRAPRDRYKHACCSSDGHVYVLGGRDSSCLRDLWRYSVVCNEWTELNCRGEAAPEELEEHSMVAHEGFLYVFGGLLDSAYSNSRYPLWLFDIAKQKWMNCRGKSGSTQTPSNRKGHSSVVVGSAMLVYGGFVDLKGSSQEFWSLDFDSMAWSLLSDPQHGSVGPGCRHGHSAVAHQSCMYLFGGLKGLREQRDFWKWNSTSCTWTSLRNKSGPSRLTGHSAVAYRDGMLLFGGGESQHSPSSCLWRYSFTSLTWTQVATLPGSSPPKKIHHSCIGLGPSYKSNSHSSSSGSGIQTRLLESRMRPFMNKCFPAPLSFLGSDGAIELETFSQDQCYDTKLRASELIKNGTQQLGNCLTFENKAYRKKSSDDEEDGDAALHLPDLLLVLGGRPCSSHGPISVWQMTLTDS